VQLPVYVHVLRVFYVFGKASSDNERFVSKVGFQIFVEVMGFTHVFENGCKCNSLWMSVFFVFVIFVSKLSEKQIRSVYPGKGLETVIH